MGPPHSRHRGSIRAGHVLVIAVAAVAAAALHLPLVPVGAAEPLQAGGNSTVADETRHAFSRYGRNMSPAAVDGWAKGKVLFNTRWREASGTPDAGDGLGPFFVARSCGTCHYRNGRGRPPASPAEHLIGAAVKLSVPGSTALREELPEPTYGGLLQTHAVGGLAPEGRVQVRYTEIQGSYADGAAYSLRRPHVSIVELGYGPFAPNALHSLRVSPAVIGLGVIETLDESAILANADPDDADGDGISGRPNWVRDADGRVRLGRFTWKAGVTRLRPYVAVSFLEDFGLTSETFPVESATAGQPAARQVPSGGSPEIPRGVVDLVTHYMRVLAVPARRDLDDPAVRRGERLFDEIGCAACHVPTLVTDRASLLPQLRGQTVHPYSDLLLHDMGPELSDGRPESTAGAAEWRTPPLWGIGLVETVNGHTDFLHDGRARGLAEAILWHGGESLASKERFRCLPVTDREALLAFLRSL